MAKPHLWTGAGWNQVKFNVVLPDPISSPHSWVKKNRMSPWRVVQAFSQVRQREKERESQREHNESVCLGFSPHQNCRPTCSIITPSSRTTTLSFHVHSRQLFVQDFAAAVLIPLYDFSKHALNVAKKNLTKNSSSETFQSFHLLCFLRHFASEECFCFVFFHARMHGSNVTQRRKVFKTKSSA